MINDLKMVAATGKEGIKELRYRLCLGDPRGILPPRILEIPEKAFTRKNYLDVICEYENMDRKETAKEIADLINKAKNDRISGYRFTEIGWNQANDTPFFAFSNCSVTTEGIDMNSYSEVKGFDLIVSQNFSSTKENAKIRLLELKNILGQKPEVLYPIFATNIAALLNQILGKRGRAPSLTMWLDGEPGSGKTELACALGSFINKHFQDNTQVRKKMFSAFGKPKNMVKSLAEHQGINFILDDVKNEKVLGQRDSSRTCVDICIRSVESQRITEVFCSSQQSLQEAELNAGAIITGEYMDIYKSSVARIVYLDVNDFVNDEKGSQALKQLQDDPYILADFMAHFIIFLCAKYLDQDYWSKIIREKDRLWEVGKGWFYGTNCSRLANNLSSLQMITRILVDFAKNCGAEISLDAETIIQKTDKIFVDIMKQTELLIYEQDVILIDAFKEIYPQIELQEPQKIISDYQELCTSPYIIDSEKDGIWIPDINELLEINSKQRQPAIICRLDRLEGLLLPKMLEKVKSYGGKGRWDYKITRGRLRKAGIICAELRNDKTFNNQFNYPSFNTYVCHDNIDDEPCVCLNVCSKIVEPWVDELEGNETTNEMTYIYDLPAYQEKRIREYNDKLSWLQFRRILKSIRNIMEASKIIGKVNIEV